MPHGKLVLTLLVMVAAIAWAPVYAAGDKGEPPKILSLAYIKADQPIWLPRVLERLEKKSTGACGNIACSGGTAI